MGFVHRMRRISSEKTEVYLNQVSLLLSYYLLPGQLDHKMVCVADLIHKKLARQEHNVIAKYVESFNQRPTLKSPSHS